MDNLQNIENAIVQLEKQRKEMLVMERPVQKERGEIKTNMARERVRVLELDEALEKIKHELDINSINLSLKKKEFWSLKNELGC